MNTLARWLVCTLLVACSSRRAQPSTVDATPSNVTVLADSGAHERRDAEVIAAPPVVPAPPPCVPSGPFAEALRVSSVLSFTVDDTVDPHATTGGSDRAKSVARVRVSDLRCDADTVVATLEWTADDGSSIPAQLPLEWRVSGGRIVEFTGESTFGESEIAQAKGPVCHLTKDKGPYGATVRRICIDKKGLFSLREENLSGPRRISLTRK